MTQSRPYIIQILKEEFKNPEKAQHIRTKTLHILKESPGSASRIFDELPSLLPKKTMQSLSCKFLNIISRMDTNPISETHGVEITNEKDKEKISLFIKEILAIGIKELLDDENGHIKPEIIEQLRLESIEKKLGRSELTLSILCGYVGAINQEIVKNFSLKEISISKYNPAYTRFYVYINGKMEDVNCNQTNLRLWALAKLKEEGHDFTKNDLLKWSRENPLIMGTAIVLGAITTASILFFNNQSGKTSDAQLFDKIKPRV